jgi:hypothetical protein
MLSDNWVTDLRDSRLIVKLALLESAWTITLPGSFAAPGGSAANDTSMSDGAAMFSVTVPRRLLPLFTLGELKPSDESSGLSAAAITVEDTSNKKMIVLKLRIALLSGIRLKIIWTRTVESITKPSCKPV